MSDDRAASPRIRRVEAGTRFHAQTDWIVAALILGAAAASVLYPVLYLNVRFVFDPDSPDFNPAVLVPVFLSVFGLKSLISAVLGTMRGRRFGQAVMEMDGETVAPGETLTGVVRVPVVLEPLGDYEVRLRCVQQVAKTTTQMRTRLKEYIRWEETLRVNAQTVNPREGIPFAFVIPTDAMTTFADWMAAGSVRWILEVKAPLRGLDFCAIFGVEVRARRSIRPEE